MEFLAQLCMARRGVRHGSSFMGPIIFAFYSPTRIFGSHGYPRAGKEVRGGQVLKGCLGPPVRSPARGTAFGVERVPSTGILIDCCKFWGRCPKWAKIGWDWTGLYEILRGRSIRVIASVPTRLVAIQKSAASNWDHREVTCSKDGTARIGSIRTKAAIVTSRAGIRAQSSI